MDVVSVFREVVPLLGHVGPLSLDDEDAVVAEDMIQLQKEGRGACSAETGSWDTSLGAFTPTKYLGSPNSSVCATGYDQLSFVQGISSNLFMMYNVSVSSQTPAVSFRAELPVGCPYLGDCDRILHRSFRGVLPEIRDPPR